MARTTEVRFVDRGHVGEPELARYRALGRGSTVTWENPPSAFWFEAWSGDRLVGAVCLVTDTGRCKSDCVDVEFRRHGIYARLFQRRISYAMALGLPRLTTYSNIFSRHQYLNAGFREIRVLRNGTAFMEKIL